MPLLGATGGGSAKGFGALANLGYFIRNSLRFRASASAYLNRTFGSTYTDKTKSTVSFWVKRGSLNVNNGHSIMWYNASGASGHITFAGAGAGGSLVNDCLYIGNRNATTGGGDYGLQTTQLFRDPSAWYHIMVVYDTGQATSSNRIKIYVNGTQVTSFVSTQYPSQNYQTTAFLGGNSTAHIIGYGATTGATEYFDGYLAEVNFIDGQALTPSSFGKTDAATGQWIPKKFAGTYGTNGFYLKFADASAATAAAIGKDSSGNGNNWTPNNISVTSGVTYDAMTDSPTLSAAASNYATLNPLKVPTPASVSYTNGNLSVSCGNGNQTPALATIYPNSGKWYWEVIWTSGSFARVGVQNTNVASTDFAADSAGWRWENNTGNIYNGSTLATVSTYATNDVLGFCLDCDTGKFYVSKNGTWQNSAVPESGTGAVATNIPTSTLMSPAVATGSGASVFALNFGQRPFAYTPPAGFKSINTFNLP